MGFFDKFTNLFWGKKVHDNLNNPNGMTDDEEAEAIMFFDYLLQEELDKQNDNTDKDDIW